MDLSLQSIKTNIVNLTPRYSHVTLVSGYPIWQLSIDYYMDALKDIC